jgi:hypothetical protein
MGVKLSLVLFPNIFLVLKLFDEQEIWLKDEFYA